MPGREATVAELLMEVAEASNGPPSERLPRSSAAYLAANPDVRSSGIDPVSHWLMFGRAEGRPWPSSRAAEDVAGVYRVLKARELTHPADLAAMVATPGLHAVAAPGGSTQLSAPEVVSEQDWHFCGPLHIRAFADFEERQFPTRIRAPEMAISHLADAICLPGQVAIAGGGEVILAESFNFWSEWSTHHHVRWIKGSHLEVAPFAEPERLEGRFLYLDNQHGAHYGHFLADVLSQAWAYRTLVEAGLDDLRVLVTPDQRPFMVDLLEAAGVPAERLTPVARPVACEQLFVPTKAFQVQGWTSAMAARLWAEIGDRLDTGAAVPRLFVSRSRNRNRGLAQAAEIDALFAERGFTVMHPEETPLAEQVSLFANSPVVAGLSGSNMFNLAFGRGRQDVFIVGSPNLVHFSEQMLMGAREVVWRLYLGRAEASATHAAWTVDARGLAAAVDAWLAELS